MSKIVYTTDRRAVKRAMILQKYLAGKVSVWMSDFKSYIILLQDIDTITLNIASILLNYKEKI